MSGGAVTISIDLELAWGDWDHLTREHVDNVTHKERPIVDRLVAILDDHRLPVTWAFVAALLDSRSAENRPGDERLWYAPDVIDRIRQAQVAHDLGSHGGRHIYLDAVSVSEAEDDLGFAQGVYAREGIDCRSFVFPRNKVARTELLSRHGIKVYRGVDRAWHQRIRNRNLPAGRIANLADKMLPIAPETVEPERDGTLTNLPGSMLFMGRNGLRRFAPAATMRTKLRKGLEAARDGGVFHLWFHPSNFWHETDAQLNLFADFARDAAAMAQRGEIAVKPMAAFA